MTVPDKPITRVEMYLDALTGGGQGGAVVSVNGKTGAVVLTASDISVRNTTSVQDNLERIDEELGSLEDSDQLKRLPGYSDTGTLTLQCVDGVLKWV